MIPYPQCLLDSLAQFGKAPSGDIEWDKALLAVCKKKEPTAPWDTLSRAVEKAVKEATDARQSAFDLADPSAYQAHAAFLLFIANEVILRPQRRKFQIDDNNRDTIKFLLYYFNGCPLCESIFPQAHHKLHKNLLILGPVGVGKTLLMQIFSEYLRRIGSPRFFHNLSVTQMVNYYTIHNNLDRFTYFEEESRGFQCKPENVCLNDIGIQDKTFFGMNTGLLTDEFLHARNEIWTQFGKCAHLTTNLTIDQLKTRFSQFDKHSRLIDRFKTYNVLILPGTSRR